MNTKTVKITRRLPGTPYKSTTTPEKFFHFPEIGITLFARKEQDAGVWAGAVALCSPTDQFSRRIGRNVSRRRYFQGKAEMLYPDELMGDWAQVRERALVLAQSFYERN